MRERVLVDTGPIVAILSRRDAYHERCVAELRSLQADLLTCWPVVTEAAWLLRAQPGAIRRLLTAIGAQVLHIADLGEDAPIWMAKFMERYQGLGAQLADAALVYLAERENIETVFTLDRRDFSVYRLSDNRALKLLPSL